MQTIQLTQGQVALVDDEDFEWLSQYSWQAKRHKKSKHFYAVRSEWVPSIKKQRTVLMHRQILGLEHGDPLKGDHKEPSETLNNQRTNLRKADDSQSACNKYMQVNNSCGFKGVHQTLYGMFVARIKIKGERIHLGTRTTPEAAYYELYVPAAQQLHGEFARVV
jgi:hypothetical protein